MSMTSGQVSLRHHLSRVFTCFFIWSPDLWKAAQPTDADVSEVGHKEAGSLCVDTTSNWISLLLWEGAAIAGWRSIPRVMFPTLATDGAPPRSTLLSLLALHAPCGAPLLAELDREPAKQKPSAPTHTPTLGRSCQLALPVLVLTLCLISSYGF